MISKLIEDIKREEDAGFKTGGMPYKDHLGYDTIGYGTLLPLTEKECEILLKHRLTQFVGQVKSSLYYLDIREEAWFILYEMAYQIGLGGLLKFKNMIKCLEEKDYIGASEEMVSSKWAKQTPNRANRLSNRMKGL